MRMLVILGVSSMSLGHRVALHAYEAGVGCWDSATQCPWRSYEEGSAAKLRGEELCTEAEVQVDRRGLMWEAMLSLDWSFSASRACAQVTFFNHDNYGTFLIVLLIACFVGISVLVFALFAQAAASSRNFDFRSGAYFVFCMTLERKPIYAAAVKGLCGMVVLLYAGGLSLVIAILGSEGLLHVLKCNVVDLCVVVFSFKGLLYPVILDAYDTWDERLLCQVTFRRKWYQAFFADNDALYQDIIIASAAMAARGDRTKLEKLCNSPEDAETLVNVTRGHQKHDESSTDEDSSDGSACELW